MGIDTGFYKINNTGIRHHYAIDVRPNFIHLAVFEHFDYTGFEANENGEYDEDVILYYEELAASYAATSENVSWEDFKGVLDNIYNPHGTKSGNSHWYREGVYISDLPNTTNGGFYRGQSIIYSDGMTGLDEITDYSLIDIMLDNAGHPLSWQNRFAVTAKEKVEYSFRHRARTKSSNALVIFMPFETTFDQCRVELLCELDPILLNDTIITGTIDDATILNDGLWFKNFYWAPVFADNITVAAGGSVTVPFNLEWNNGTGACEQSTKLKLNSDSGYLPKQRVTTDASGEGSFVVTALGLSAGDIINVKINTEHYTAIGKVSIQVT